MRGLRGRWLLALFGIQGVAAAVVLAQPLSDWPQYLGSHRNGVAAAPIPQTAKLAVAWRRKFPEGGSAIAVAAGRVYALGSEGGRDNLFSLNASDGSDVWRMTIGDTHADAASGPASTPAVAGDLVVALGSSCRLLAVRAATGDVVWERNLGEAYNSPLAARGGCGMSPLLADGRVIVPTGARVGARLAAFDAASGKEMWTAAELPNTLNGALGLVEAGGSRHVLYHHARPPGVSGVTAVDLRTGAVAWQIDGPSSMSDTMPLPFAGNRLLLQTWSNSTVFDTSGARRPLWTNTEISAIGPPAVYHGGHIYGFGGNSGEFLKCVDAGSGQARWSTRIYRGYAAVAGDTIVVLSESSGFVRLVAADPASYRELARVQALTPGARTGSPPAVAGTRVFVRNLEEVVAVEAR